MGEGTGAVACLWRTGSDFQDSVLIFHHMGSEDRTQGTETFADSYCCSFFFVCLLACCCVSLAMGIWALCLKKETRKDLPKVLQLKKG